MSHRPTHRDLVADIRRIGDFQRYLKLKGIEPLLRRYSIDDLVDAGYEALPCSESTRYERYHQLRRYAQQLFPSNPESPPSP